MLLMCMNCEIAAMIFEPQGEISGCKGRIHKVTEGVGHHGLLLEGCVRNIDDGMMVWVVW